MTHATRLTDSTDTASAVRADRPIAGGSTELPQYSLARIFGTWAAAALPMAFLAWIVAPRLWRSFDGPSAGPRALILCLTLGLIWQFLVVAALVRREQGTLRWGVVKDALWLRAPRRPRTGRRGGWLWLLIIPLVLGIAAKAGHPISFWRVTKYGVVVTFATLLVSWCYVWLRYFT